MLSSPQFQPSMPLNANDRSGLITQCLNKVRQELTDASIKYGRPPSTTALLAVSKAHSVEAVRSAAAAGQLDFGESYLQEALPKIAACTSLNLTWHYIGQLQSNKTRQVAENFAWVHTVDREKIALRLNEQRPHYAQPLQTCIQVKLGNEETKGGIDPSDAAQLAESIIDLPRIKLRGLMCIPPATGSFAQQRTYFAELANLQKGLNNRLASRGVQLDTLSMGMSADFEAAIAEGATIVRIGTAIFGSRI